ncbi:hypothetical protein ACFL2K_02415 [Candidatus Margulisiibacteriota bacterium]
MKKLNKIILIIAIFFIIPIHILWANIIVSRDPFEPTKETTKDRLLFTAKQKREEIIKVPGKQLVPKKYHIKIVGILWSEKDASALILINGKTHLFEINSAQYDIIIIKILPDRVLLKTKNKNYILEVGKELYL